MFARTLGELRKLTAELPDSTPLLRPAGDHSYADGLQVETTSLLQGRVWAEDVFDGPVGEVTEYGTRIAAVALGG